MVKPVVKGRQNYLAAASIFNSQLQPTYIGKATEFWLQPAAINIDVSPKSFHPDTDVIGLLYVILRDKVVIRTTIEGG